MIGRTYAILVVGSLMLMANGCAKSALVKDDTAPVAAAPKMAAATTGTGAMDPKTGADRKQPESVPATPAQAAGLQSSSQSANQGALEPIPNAGELQLSLEKVYFAFDSALLSPEARQVLVTNADKIRHGEKLAVRIEGNCDERGSDEYNLALGERRAKAALQYLLTLGVPENRLSIISYGKEKPLATGHDEVSWAKNRRDEFVITAQ